MKSLCHAAIAAILAVCGACGQTRPVETGGPDAGERAPFSDGAADFPGVQAAANLDSVVLTLPALPAAKDFRAFALPAGSSVKLAADGTEQVDGTVIYCAGLRQHNAAVQPAEPVRQLEITGVTGPVHLIVEALDRPCPFPGLIGNAHADIKVENTEIDLPSRVGFSIYTEAEVRAKYGSLIVNGQGPAATLGQQAPRDNPKVLARAQLDVAPQPASARPAMTFFDDFSANDQPVPLGVTPDASRSSSARLYQNSNWSIYAFGFDTVQPFIDRGQFQVVLADNWQDVFASVLAYPRKTVALSAADYLHVTYEVQTNATSRRYWEVQLCGAETLGQTMDARGLLKQPIVPTSSFMEPDGRDPSVAGWNCLQIFPRDGWPVALGPGNSGPETDLRVMVNTKNAGGDNRTNVVNLSPDLYHDASQGPPGWYRQLDANHKPVAPMLDDLQQTAPRVHWDLYIRRNRVILYANGKQRLCNDFPAHALTMAEGALAFSQVLYHSAAERMEFSVDYWLKTGQRYYLTDAPYADVRAWDNLGYDEHVQPPASFDPALCFNHG